METEGDLTVWAVRTARAIAHAHMPRCIDGTGHGHTDECEALASDIINAMRSAINADRRLTPSEAKRGDEQGGK